MSKTRLRTTEKAAKGSIADVGQVPAVSRAVAILRLLGKSEVPMGVNEIARELNIIPSTALHILRVLAAHEMVAPDSSKKYQLDAGVLTLARSLLRPRSFGPAVQPYLDKVSEKFRVLAVGSRVIGLDHYVIMATSRPRSRGVHLHIDVGTRIPALLSSTGHCVAAFTSQTKAKIRQAFIRQKWKGAPSFDQWMKDVELARKQGYAVDQLYIRAMTTVAAPVLDDSGIISHAVAVVGVTESFSQSDISQIGEELKRIGEIISKRLSKST